LRPRSRLQQAIDTIVQSVSAEGRGHRDDPNQGIRSGKPTKLPRLAALITALLGLAVLAGWAFDVPALKAVIPGAVEMKANTALGLVLAAVALFILCEPRSPPLWRLAQAFALAAAALGFASVGQFAFGWLPGIDEWPFHGRMAPHTGAALALIGLALAALPRPALRPMVLPATAIVIAIGAIGLLGYLWDAKELVTEMWLPPSAVHTALAFVLLGAGALRVRFPSAQQPGASRPNQGGSIENRVLFGFGGVLVLLLLTSGYVVRKNTQFIEAAHQVAHTQEVRSALNALDRAIFESESAQRNYVRTGAPADRETYLLAMADAGTQRRNLTKLVGDNPEQLHNLDTLQKLVDLRLAAIARHVAILQREGSGAALAAIARDGGIQTMRAIGLGIERMEQIESALLLTRKADLERIQKLPLLAMLALLAAGAIMLTVLYRHIRRAVAARAGAEQAAVAARKEAEKANASKDTFLATMSHEIRTPLNGLLGMLELLALTRLDVEQKGTLGIARDSGHDLLRIIDDVLDHAKIAAGKLEIRPQPVSIADLACRVRNSYLGVASAKGLALVSVVDPLISPSLVADPLRVSQILNNFVSNALKFTAEGQVEIVAALVARSSGSDTIRLSVKDTGIGIAEDAQRRLFQPFEQAETVTTRPSGGTGLGLSISRRLTEMMGGTIKLESAPGLGTTISATLTLPISDTVAASSGGDETPAATPLRAAASPGASPLVLAVDDHPTNRKLLALQLGALGLRVQTAAEGREALDLWQAGAIDLIVTDCNMPKMDGYALARAVREIEARDGRARTPIVAWTANVLPGAAALCIASGMDDVLVKPTALAVLKAVLSKWLPAAPAADDATGPGAPGAAPPVFAELEDLAATAAERAEILQDFMTQTRSDFAGLQAASTLRDLPDCARIAHRMKGSSRLVGAQDMAAACEKLEHAARQGSPEDATLAQAAMALALQGLESTFAGSHGAAGH